MCDKVVDGKDTFWVEAGFTFADKEHVWKEKNDKKNDKTFYVNQGTHDKKWKLPGEEKEKKSKDKTEKSDKKEKKEKKASSDKSESVASTAEKEKKTKKEKAKNGETSPPKEKKKDTPSSSSTAPAFDTVSSSGSANPLGGGKTGSGLLSMLPSDSSPKKEKKDKDKKKEKKEKKEKKGDAEAGDNKPSSVDLLSGLSPPAKGSPTGKKKQQQDFTSLLFSGGTTRNSPPGGTSGIHPSFLGDEHDDDEDEGSQGRKLSPLALTSNSNSSSNPLFASEQRDEGNMDGETIGVRPKKTAVAAATSSPAPAPLVVVNTKLDLEQQQQQQQQHVDTEAMLDADRDDDIAFETVEAHSPFVSWDAAREHIATPEEVKLEHTSSSFEAATKQRMQTPTTLPTPPQTTSSQQQEQLREHQAAPTTRRPKITPPPSSHPQTAVEAKPTTQQQQPQETSPSSIHKGAPSIPSLVTTAAASAPPSLGQQQQQRRGSVASSASGSSRATTGVVVPNITYKPSSVSFVSKEDDVDTLPALSRHEMQQLKEQMEIAKRKASSSSSAPNGSSGDDATFSPKSLLAAAPPLVATHEQGEEHQQPHAQQTSNAADVVDGANGDDSGSNRTKPKRPQPLQQQQQQSTTAFPALVQVDLEKEFGDFLMAREKSQSPPSQRMLIAGEEGEQRSLHPSDRSIIKGMSKFYSQVGDDDDDDDDDTAPSSRQTGHEAPEPMSPTHLAEYNVQHTLLRRANTATAHILRNAEYSEDLYHSMSDEQWGEFNRLRHKLDQLTLSAQGMEEGLFRMSDEGLTSNAAFVAVEHSVAVSDKELEKTLEVMWEVFLNQLDEGTASVMSINNLFLEIA